VLNLYWKTDGQTRSLVETPFRSEAEFESFIFENQDILGDIYIIYRQIRTGQKQGIPDMLGVDQDANICIIEIESEHGQEATAQFRRTVDAITTFVQQQGWEIQQNLNKYYVGFKVGNRLVFSVQWGGTYAWKVWFKIPEDVARSFEAPDWELQIYDEKYHAALFRPLRPSSPNIESLKPLFVEAYQYSSGVR
jgi:hypothetical protein